MDFAVKRSKTLELNPNYWDLEGLERKFERENIDFLKDEVCSIHVEYRFEAQSDANKAFDIIYGGMKPGIGKYFHNQKHYK